MTLEMLPLITFPNFLTINTLITTAAGNIWLFQCVLFFRNIKLDISCESSATQMIHMKCQVLFSQKNNANKKKLECHLLQFCSAL